MLISHNIQFNVNQEIMNYLHTLEKYRDRQKRLKTFDVKNAIDVKLDKIEINNICESNNPHNLKLQYISKSDNEKMYCLIENQLNKEVFNGIPMNSYLRVISNGFERFKKLDVHSQVVVLMEMLKIVQCKFRTPNFVAIGGTKTCMALNISKNITSKDLQVLSQSITGIYENTVFDNLKD